MKIILYLFIKGENVVYRFSRVLVYMIVIWYIDLYVLILIFVFCECLDAKLLCFEKKFY